MKNYIYDKYFLIMGVMFLLILVYSPMVESSNEKSIDSKFMDNLKFYYYDEHFLSGSSVYQEKFLDYVSGECLTGSNNLVSSFETISYGNDGLMSSAWPMQCHDSKHTSRSPYSTENITELEKWRFWWEAWVECGPVIDNNGIIYFTTTHSDVHAIYPNGSLKWTYETNGYMSGSTPAIAEDGTIYVGSWDERLYAINQNGTLKWRTWVGGGVASSPAIAEDGTIYIDTMKEFDKGEIVAINPDGTKKWAYETDYLMTSDPAIGEDGTIYTGSGDYYIYAMNPNGTLKWRFKTGDEIHGHPSIAEDGTIYIGSWDDYLYALNPDGTMKWKYKMSQGTTGNPAISEDGTIYVCSDKMYAIYPNGTLRWSCSLGNNRWVGHSSPAISADGTIYVGTHIGDGAGGDIVAINANGTDRWRKKLADFWIDSSPCIGEDGTVYIGSTTGHGGYLHAFGPIDSNSPPETPTISGKTEGETGTKYQYIFRAVDPDNNPIMFYIDWGDGSEGWKDERASDVKCGYRHTWSEDGNYTIRAKVKDIMGEESDWASLEITMPKTKQSSNYGFLRFLEKHPHMFPIIRQIVGLEQ